VSLAAALATDGDLGRRERRHELAASQQLADEDDAVAAIGLDHPEGSAGAVSEPDDPRDELVDRRSIVVDSLPDDLRVLGRAGDNAMAVSARVDADDQSRAHPTTSVFGRRTRGSSHDRDCHLTHMSDRAQMSNRLPLPNSEGVALRCLSALADRAIEPSPLVRPSLGPTRSG